MTIEKGIIDHYSRGGLMETIQQALLQSGKDMTALVPDDLSAIDELHIGGRATTAHLMTYLQFRPEHHVLDVGSGLGGAARYVVAQNKAAVSCIDLTPEYCNTAAALTGLVGMGEYILYRQGSALALPFPDAEFDGAYTIHTAMNIQDKTTFYAQIYRVLKPGAFFGLYDVMAGSAPEPLEFPLPWATTAETSFLISPDDLKVLLAQTGFEVITEDDLRGYALLTLKKFLDADPSPLGPHIIMGDDYKIKITNLLNNISKKKCAPRVIICRKPTLEEIT